MISSSTASPRWQSAGRRASSRRDYPHEQIASHSLRPRGIGTGPVEDGFHVVQPPGRPAAIRAASRGCPEFCTYCPHRILAGYRARSIANIADELERLCDQYRRPYVIFRDPLFTEQRERVVELCDEIQRRGLNLTFEAETRLDRLDIDLLDRLYAAGFRAMSFGVESLDPATLKKSGRRPIPRATSAKSRHARTILSSPPPYVLASSRPRNSIRRQSTMRSLRIDVRPVKMLSVPGRRCQAARSLDRERLEKFEALRRLQAPELTIASSGSAGAPV